MQIHELRPKIKFKKRKRVGRGGKRGTYCGRGMKGQKSRTGSGGKHIVEKGRDSWVKKFPKLGGFNSVDLKNLIIKTSDLEKVFKTGDKIDPKVLLKNKLISKPKRSKTGRYQSVKILKDSSITKKFVISGCLVSKSAKKAIETKGGSIESVDDGKNKKTTKATKATKDSKISKTIQNKDQVK
ncbi:MAG: 50S ribosomal protein L15 [Candidatus Moranbacteria bacterium]|nr:50S ribosomal protein L15 [Candidatus Moranbacteria bacterium]